MIVPSYEYAKVFDDNGDFTPQWRQIITVLLQQLQIAISNNGFAIPNRTTADITNLLNMLGPGGFWYDTTISKFRGNEAGVLKTFTTT
jgi:hypothetical protein